MARKPGLLQEIESIVAGVDADACKTKSSLEKRMFGKALFSPKDLNVQMSRGFEKLEWSESRTLGLRRCQGESQDRRSASGRTTE
jgi:hypothetical protein